MEWLTLLDGAPLVARANTLTGRRWPRLAGSDLIGPILDGAAQEGLTVGFLGGAATTHIRLREVLASTRPGLRVAGWWAPERAELADPGASLRIAAEIRRAGIDILIIGLGKPRQELWIAEYGDATGAQVLLAFGAVVDFLAGRVRRAPAWASEHGLEWAWRLALEPRRLARRYLVQGPPAYLDLRRYSTPAVSSGPVLAVPLPPPSAGAGRFTPATAWADVAAIVVTHNNADDVDPLLASLREQTAHCRVRVVVADNDSADATVDRLRRHEDVHVLRTGGNLGYAAGVNRAIAAAGDVGAYLILNPDLTIERGALPHMLDRLSMRGAVDVQQLGDDGTVYPSLRREPTPVRVLFDAVSTQRLRTRTPLPSEDLLDPEAYANAHPVEWATGAALLVRADVARDVGEWDERYFLYSEETDYCRRLRQAGAAIWYEPRAIMTHRQGGSGTSPDLTALMAINRVRYTGVYHGSTAAAAVRMASVLRAALRANDAGQRRALRALVAPRTVRLPGPRGAS